MQEEEEERKREEAKRLEEEVKQKRLKELNIKESELKLIQENRKKTQEMFKKEGTNETLEEFLSSLKDRKFVPKKKKKGKNFQEQKKGGVKEEEEVNNEEKKTGKEVPVYDEEEAKNAKEIGEKKFVAENNEDVDDWEDEVNNEEGGKEDKEKEIKENKGENEVNSPQNTVETNQAPESKEQENTIKSTLNSEEKIEKIPLKPKEDYRLRAPIVCILGHVDAGKTKILDKLRHSNVQMGEAGGITQQIGATFIPIENILKHISKIDKKFQIETKIPGILLIDTPGHASFTNLRSRGSSLCDIAVLILNIEKGIEIQSEESLELLKQRKTPYIIALNQYDRIHNWQSVEWSGFREAYDRQKKQQQKRFEKLLTNNKTMIIKQNINSELYYDNTDMTEYVNLVPTSAITGEGLPDLLGLLVFLSQKYLNKKIRFQEEVKCSILEVKVTESIGTTIDVILVNGTLHTGDKIVVGGLFGPIRTTVKIILMPHPMKEMRVRCEFDRYDEISGAIGVKLFCPDLENALAGSPLYVYHTEEEAQKFEREISKDFDSIVQKDLSKNGKGIMVQASTLGSLEAILTYLTDQKIDVCIVGVGNLTKKDVMKLQIKRSEDEDVKKEDMVILCFDNKILPEAEQFAKESNIKIFNDQVIYHLFDQYIEYKKQCFLERKKAKEKEAIFPCILKTVMFINKKDPLILGVDVVEGILKLGTPIYCIEKSLPIGIVESMEKDHKAINNVKPNDGSVSIRLKVFDSSLAAGRHFDEKSTYCSQISRNSIDALKSYFRDEMTTDDWKLVIKIKKILNIP